MAQEVLKNKKFKWSTVLSGFSTAKTKEEEERQFMSGLPGNVPYESEMIKEWNPPFLFYKFFIYGLIVMILSCICSYMYGFGDAMVVSVVPYMIPITILIFIWELNIPRNVSILDVICITALSGISCFLVIFFIKDTTGIVYSDSAMFTMPLLSEVAKVLFVCVFLRKKSRGYGLNGLVIGAAVGAGYAIMKTSNDLFYVAEYIGETSGILGYIIVKIVRVIGGDIVWTAAIGGAIALAKGKETLKAKHLGDSLVLICAIGTYLIELLWSYDITGFFAKFADSDVMVGIYKFLYVYQGKYILLTVAAWALLLFVARTGVEQALDIASRTKDDQRKWNSKIAANYTGNVEIRGMSGAHGGRTFKCTSQSIVFGRDNSCGVRFAPDAKGISGIHCEISKQGENYVLIDKNSSYGTYLKNGQKLESGKPYVLQNNMEFYLASEQNSYKVSIQKEQSSALQDDIKYGKRTNEIDGVEESGQNVYIACALVIAVMFGAFYMTSDKGAYMDSVLEENADKTSFYGAWTSNASFDIKSIILNHVDNWFVIGDLWFKDSMADGIVFTRDGKAYCTYNGYAIDYAQFEYSIVDNSTLYLSWRHNVMDVSATIGFADIIKSIGDETGFNVRYNIDGQTMYLDFAGYSLVMYR